jgi:AcrR family transcriptional regulator
VAAEIALDILLKNEYSFFMPKKSPADMAARRRQILEAGRRCFARKGFAATTIADLAREAGASAGGIYTHFESKHAIAEAITSQLTDRNNDEPPIDLLLLYDQLTSDDGLLDAQLDLNLWAAALRDPDLRHMVLRAMENARAAVRTAVPKRQRSAGRLALLEAVMLGLEVQRALQRPQPRSLRAELRQLVGANDA